MLLTRILTSVEDLNRYSELYFTKSGILVKLSYLKNSHVRIFYKVNNPDKWIAGYVQNGNGDLRYFQSLPSSRNNDFVAQMGVVATDILETGCTFIDRMSPLERHQVYLTLIAEAYMSGKAVLLGGSIIPKVQNYQMLTMPHLLIEEKMEFDGKEILMKQYYGFRSEFLRRSMALFLREFREITVHSLVKTLKRIKVAFRHSQTSISH